MTEHIHSVYQLVARPKLSVTRQNRQVWEGETEWREPLELETLKPETLNPETLEPETLSPERLS